MVPYFKSCYCIALFMLVMNAKTLAAQEVAPLLKHDEASTHPDPIIAGNSVEGRQKVSGTFLSKVRRDADALSQKYAAAKSRLQNETGLSYTIDASYMGQRGAPNGHITPWQSQYYGTATWNMFDSSRWGKGSANISYELVRYWNGTGAQLGNNIGVLTPLNDYTLKGNYFYALNYTHQLAGKWNWLSATLGQFPMFNFDGTTYDSNQQINFVNETFSQNATSLYPSAGIGGYVTIAPNDFWNVSFGGQDAYNLSGNRITTRRFAHKIASFVSGTVNPQNRLGKATVSLMLYYQPRVEEQPYRIKGWSMNFQQNISSKWALFGRVNGVNKGASGIRQSYVLGGIYNNPLNRNALDQIGFSGGVNKLDKQVNGPASRGVENVMEGYWAWGIGAFMTITPDVQFYIHPGLNKKSDTATVATLRATLMF